MFVLPWKKKDNSREFKMPEGLSRKQQEEVKVIIKNARKDDGTPRSAQQTLPFERMFPDGICRVGGDFYTKTIQFQDINYQLAQQEDKTEIFEEWCGFLNFFDSSVQFQLSFMNFATEIGDFEKKIAIPHQEDGFNDVRDEYSGILLKNMQAGNNGLTKVKYITFGIHADSMKSAKPRLIHIEMDILNNFKRLGVIAETLNGAQRLELMHRQTHMGDNAKFHFDWKYLAGSGLSVKDFVAPSSFEFPNGRYFKRGDTWCAMSFLSIDASDVSDRMLADFLGMESSQIVTMHLKSVDQNEAIKTVKHTITELDRSKIEEQKKAVRAGYDMEIIPSDLATYGKDAKALLKELQSQNERMFLLTFLIMNTGKTKEELDNNLFQASSIAQKHSCNLIRLDFQQEQGFVSTLPLAYNEVDIQRGMTTSSTAIFVPFTTQELFQDHRGALYYGLNALSNNLIMVDRKMLKNPNGLILGTPGSGKSFAAKREIVNSFLVTDDDIIISDPEAEYRPLVEHFGGQVIKISPTSDQYINPMDINMNYSDDDSPVMLKADFILSLCELIVGGKDGLLPVEKTVIDRISPAKDVDGFHPMSVGALCIGEPGFVSCTPAGIIQLLKRSGVEIAGKECVIVGRSNIVGKPMALLMLRENATVTVTHSRTKDLPAVCRRADILIAAIGKAKMITEDYVKEGAVIIDVGINRDPESGKLFGDVDYENVFDKCSAITPVPGGVGPMTIAMLMNNCLEAAIRSSGAKL